MRKILIFVLVLISVESFGQNPPNYTNIFGRYRWIAGMFDSGLHVPRYNGVPSGLRVGMSPNDGALAADTLNGHFYGYWNTAWKRLAYYTDIATGQINIYNSDGYITDADRYVKGLNDTKGIVFDSMNYFMITRNNVTRFYMNNLVTRINSPDESQYFATENDSSYVIADNNFMIWKTDSTISRKKIVYPGNIHGLFNAYTLVDKSYVDSVSGGGGGSGTVNTGAALKAAYYPSGGTTVDDWVGVEFGNTNLNTKITAQATTEVPLEIKLAGSQTANALNISSSGGTGDIFNVQASSSGIVGIGTTTPATYLPGGNGLAINGSGNVGVSIRNSGSGTYHLIYNTGTALALFSSATGGNVLQVLNDGRMTLGTFSPTARLHITGGTATASTAPLKINSGTVLATTEAGAIENDGTHLYYSATNGGARYQLDQQKPSLNKAVTIEAPSASEAVDMWQTPVAITVTSLKAILRGSSPSVTYNVRFGTDITSSTDVFTSNITCTSVTTGCSNSSGFNDATIPAGSFIWVITSAMSGTVNSISLTLNYTED